MTARDPNFVRCCLSHEVIAKICVFLSSIYIYKNEWVFVFMFVCLKFTDEVPSPYILIVSEEQNEYIGKTITARYLKFCTSKYSFNINVLVKNGRNSNCECSIVVV